jgi:hypothetical protein
LWTIQLQTRGIGTVTPEADAHVASELLEGKAGQLLEARHKPNNHVGSWLRSSAYARRLKNCTAFSCFSAAARVLNVPRLRRFPVFGFFVRE